MDRKFLIVGMVGLATGIFVWTMDWAKLRDYMIPVLFVIYGLCSIGWFMFTQARAELVKFHDLEESPQYGKIERREKETMEAAHDDFEQLLFRYLWLTATMVLLSVVLHATASPLKEVEKAPTLFRIGVSLLTAIFVLWGYVTIAVNFGWMSLAKDSKRIARKGYEMKRRQRIDKEQGDLNRKLNVNV